MEDGISVRTDLDTDLFGYVEPPLVSIYMPIRGEVDTRADQIQFEHFIQQARAELAQAYEAREVRGLNAKLDHVIDRFGDLKNNAPEGGIAAFISNDRSCLYNLRYAVRPHVMVGERFYLKPLLRNFQYGSQYFLLGISADRFTFIHGDFGSLHRVTLPANVHDALSKLFEEVYDDDRTGALNYASLNNHLSPYRGWKSRNDVKEEGAEKFFYYVNKAVGESLIKNTRLPVILVSLPKHQSRFRALSTIPNLLPEGIEKDVNGLDAPGLLAEAVRIIERERARRAKATVDEYKRMAAAGSATDDLATIEFALRERKVRILLVEETDVDEPFDKKPGVAKLSEDEDADRKDLNLMDSYRDKNDLMDAFAQATLKQGGEICFVDANLMPTDTHIAAIFRY